MADRIQPEGESLRRAVKWLSDERKQHPDRPTHLLVDEASLRFDLSPKDADALMRYTKGADPQA